MKALFFLKAYFQNYHLPNQILSSLDFSFLLSNDLLATSLTIEKAFDPTSIALFLTVESLEIKLLLA